MKLKQPLLLNVLLIGSALFLGGCAANGEKMAETDSHPLNNDDYYEVHHEGRVYIFDDADTYLTFLNVGETAYRKVRIGAGSHGETVVFGLTSADKKKSEGIASIELYDGKLAAADEGFYAELQMEGRIYVFDNWGELQAVKLTGEAAYRYTQIGAGPKGETVVFVLTKENKKAKPEASIARFKALHKI